MSKVLYLDIETAPLYGTFWGVWKQNIDPKSVIRDWIILSWSACWEDGEVISYSLPDFPNYRENMLSDAALLDPLWKLMDEADAIVAHFGKGFDFPKINTRFLINGFPPPSPYKKVDTKEIAKKIFKFTFNSLDGLAKALGCSRKGSPGGIEIWHACLEGDPKAWEKMVKYNEQDVIVLKEVAKRLLPWAGIALHRDKEHCCPACGSEKHQKRGTVQPSTIRYQRFVCKDCGAWYREAIGGKRVSHVAPMQV